MAASLREVLRDRPCAVSLSHPAHNASTHEHLMVLVQSCEKGQAGQI
jgi:hypothetical protein